MGTRAPAWRHFSASELRLSRDIDAARVHLEAAEDAGDENVAAIWRRLLADLEALIPDDPSGA